MSDLDKLMSKLKKEEPKADPVEKEQEEADDGDDEDFNKQEGDIITKDPVKEEKSDEVPVDHEVALLHNDGIFRRELLITLKELIDVHKVNTQTLLDLKKMIGNDGKGK